MGTPQLRRGTTSGTRNRSDLEALPEVAREASAARSRDRRAVRSPAAL